MGAALPYYVELARVACDMEPEPGLAVSVTGEGRTGPVPDQPGSGSCCDCHESWDGKEGEAPSLQRWISCIQTRPRCSSASGL